MNRRLWRGYDQFLIVWSDGRLICAARESSAFYFRTGSYVSKKVAQYAVASGSAVHAVTKEGHELDRRCGEKTPAPYSAGLD